MVLAQIILAWQIHFACLPTRNNLANNDCIFPAEWQAYFKLRFASKIECEHVRRQVNWSNTTTWCSAPASPQEGKQL